MLKRLLYGCALLAADDLFADSPRPIDYSRDVRPILSAHCFQCHGPDGAARQAELRLDQREGATRELPSGSRAIVPSHPTKSELLARLSSGEPETVMPPSSVSKRPTPRDIETLRQWIAEGAPYAVHWAYQPPGRPSLPSVSNPEWPINDIDRFILNRLDRERLRPTSPADRRTLLRRAALDLTGLPPSLDEVERFVDDTGPDAFERAVDRLLASPAYGERWASMWLDLARYADSSGYIHDPPRSIWRWRDWLIQSLNDNRPYDQFNIEMLAGDLLDNPTTEQIIATGFHRNTTMNTEGGANAEEYHFAAVVDRVNTTMQVWMGSTFACAQCHNHKYDPFSQKEYYQLFAIFNGTADFNSEAPTLDAPRIGQDTPFARLTVELDDARQRLNEETRQLAAMQSCWEQGVNREGLPKELAEAFAIPWVKRTAAQQESIAAHQRSTSEDWKGRDHQVKRLQSEWDQVASTTLVMKEIDPRPTHLAIRGEFQNRGERVTPGFPAVFHAAPSGVKLDRLGLAKWMVDPANPLTARVAVNRLWQEIFGVGIVESSEDFGMQGEAPTHPELLDYLATDYMRTGWDTKRLLKLIVTSAAYRQSSHAAEELIGRDPYNRLLARGPRTRLSAEAVRDQALAVSGLLSPKMYGPPVHPFQPVNGLAAAFGQSTDWVTSAGEDAHRRALYTRWRRNLPYPSMIAFDVPERAVCSARRIRTNTPIQALVTLNDPVFVEAAQALARRILAEGGATTRSRAEFGLRVALRRPASPAETERLVSLFETSRSLLAAEPARAVALATKPLGALPNGVDAVEAASWTVVGNVLLNLDEFLVNH